MDIFQWLETAIGDWFFKYFLGYAFDLIENGGMPSDRPIEVDGTQDVGGSDPFTGSPAADAFTTVASIPGDGTVASFTNQSADVEVDDPFAASRFGDTSNWLAANDDLQANSIAGEQTPSQISDTPGSSALGTVEVNGSADSFETRLAEALASGFPSGVVYDNNANAFNYSISSGGDVHIWNNDLGVNDFHFSALNIDAAPPLAAPPASPLETPPATAATPIDLPSAAASPPTAAATAPPAPATTPPAPQPSNQGDSPTASQVDEENWGAAKAGMWDSLVDTAQGLSNLGRNAVVNSLAPGLGFFLDSNLPPISFDGVKFGTPAPTGNPARDAELLDNYRSGGWVTTTVSLAAPFAAEGVLSSALAAATKLPALEGAGMMGGGRLIGATEQWLSTFGETSEALGPELSSSLPPAGGGAPPVPPGTGAYQAIMSMKLKQAATDLGELGYTTKEIRNWHFFEATDSLNPESISAQLDALRASDPEAAQAVIDEIQNNEVALHHSTEEGVMELVYKSEHTSPQFRDLFHPDGKGGMSRWGPRYGGP